MKLFWKLFLTLWVSILAFTVLVGVLHVVFVEGLYPDPPEVAYRHSMGRVERALAEALERGDTDQARRQFRQLPRNMKRQLYLFDPDGKEVLGRERVRHMLTNDRIQHKSRTLTDAGGRNWELLVLRRAPPARVWEPGFKGLLHRSLVAALVAAIVSWFLARHLTRPLERLGAASRQLAGLDLSARVGEPLTSRADEFGGLARDLDDMASHLQSQQQANRQLMRDVSHELRSPLARLQVALEIARNRGPSGVETELDRIQTEGQRLEQLINEVLDLQREYSESVPLNLEQFDLVELLEDLAEAVAYEAGDQHPGLQCNAKGPLVMNADRELLWRALENLLRNALHHSGPGTSVTLECAEQGTDSVSIQVRDTGPGIPEAQLERIFEPFYRVEEARDRSSGGHGLGLAIAAAAIRRHRGSISARNHPEGGLEISMVLPRDEAGAGEI